jgi:putative lipoprotein
MRAFISVLALAACTAEPVKQDAPPAETSRAEASATDVQSALAQMPAWDGARAAGVDFRAVGQEPGWIVDVYTQNRIVLLLDYGETLIELPRAEPTYPVEGATRYETQGGGHSASITIRRAPCEDAMSGEAYPSTVEVVIDGRTLQGCGRSV